MENNKFDIQKYIKKDKDLVVEINEVEYVVNDDSLDAIQNGETSIPLVQLYDGHTYPVTVQEIEETLNKSGPIDFIDKK